MEKVAANQIEVMIVERGALLIAILPKAKGVNVLVTLKNPLLRNEYTGFHFFFGESEASVPSSVSSGGWNAALKKVAAHGLLNLRFNRLTGQPVERITLSYNSGETVMEFVGQPASKGAKMLYMLTQLS